MSKLIKNIKAQTQSDVLTDTEMQWLIPGTPDRRHSMVKRAIKQGDLIHLRRGLYVLAPQEQRRGISLFELAPKLYGPSYISLESALSYHQWIPEAVYTVTSVTSRRATEIETSLGVFSYECVPAAYLYDGVERVGEDPSVVFIAQPWKALVDLVYVKNPGWKGVADLVGSMRIEEEKLKNPPWDLLLRLEENYACRRVRVFLQRMKRDLL
jgi:predicted transcriptional regulator of viral defense system